MATKRRNEKILLFFLSLALINIILSFTAAKESPLTTHAWTLIRLASVPHPGDLIPIHQVLSAEKEGTRRIYREFFFRRHIKFIYPPTALLFYYPFRNLPPQKFLSLFADIVNRLFLGLGILLNYLLFFRFFPLSRSRLWAKVTALISFTLLLFTFYPFFKAFTLGQSQVWINTLILLALMALLKGKDQYAGIAIAICTLIKPSYGLVLLWGFLGRRWKLVRSFLIVLLLGLAVSVHIFGWENHTDYLRVFRLISERGEGYYPNQSFNGLLNRACFNSNNRTWDAHRYPPPHPVVQWGSRLGSLLVLLIGLGACLTQKKSPPPLQFIWVSLAVSLASPIAWEHSYGYTFIFFLLALAAFWHRSPGRYLPLVLTTGAFLLSSHFLYFLTLRFHQSSFNFLQSYLFFAELILFILWIRFGKEILPSFSPETNSSH